VQGEPQSWSSLRYFGLPGTEDPLGVLRGKRSLHALQDESRQRQRFAAPVVPCSAALTSPSWNESGGGRFPHVEALAAALDTVLPVARFANTGDNSHTMKITQVFTFEAAHRLPNVPRTHRCYNLHGHSYRVELQVEGPVDPITGFVVDFFDVETAFEPLLLQVDHRYLNEVDGLENPTAENIAVWIWDRTKALLPQVSRVIVYETPLCWAEYDGR